MNCASPRLVQTKRPSWATSRNRFPGPCPSDTTSPLICQAHVRFRSVLSLYLQPDSSKREESYSSKSCVCGFICCLSCSFAVRQRDVRFLMIVLCVGGVNNTFWTGNGEPILFVAAKKDLQPCHSVRLAGPARRPACSDDASVRAQHAKQIWRNRVSAEGQPCTSLSDSRNIQGPECT